MRRSFAKALGEIAEADGRVVLMTADLGFMVLEEFAERFPSRFFNVGVAEANMVGLATGLASCGYIPYVYSIATFATMRPYEQIRNGPVLHSLPVRIVGTGGGFEYGAGGVTHHALEDLGICRIQPNLTVIAPADHRQATCAVHDTYDYPGPIYYRLGKRDDYEIPGLEGRFTVGRAEVVREGEDVLIISVGSISVEAMQAVDLLEEAGIEATVMIVASLRPAPEDDLREMLSKFEVAATVEEHYVEGGLGSLVSEIIAGHGIHCRLVRCGIRGMSIGECGSEASLREAHDLSPRRIFRTVLEAL